MLKQIQEKKEVIIGIAAIILITLVVWNPFTSKQEGVIERAFARVFDANSMEIQGKLDAKADIGQADLAQRMGFVLEFVQQIKNSGKPAGSQAQGKAEIQVSTEGVNFSARLEDIVVDKKIYLKILSLPALPIAGIDGSSLKNQWFQIDQEMIQKIFQQNQATDITNIDENTQRKIYQEISAIMKNKKLFDAQEQGKKDNFGNHYLVSVNKEAVKTILFDILSGFEKYVPQEELPKYKQNIQQALGAFPAQVDDFWQKTGGIEFDAWVKNGYLSKIKWQKQIDFGSTKNPLSQTSEIPEGAANITFELSFGDFNKRFDIQAPEDFSSLEEALMPLLGSFTPQVATTTNPEN